MGERRDIVSLEVGGQTIDRWVSYRVDSDVFVPADAFDLQVDVPVSDRGEMLSLTAPGAPVKLYVERLQRDGTRRRSLQLTGIIDKRSMEVSRSGGLAVKLTGRDRASLLTDANVQPGIICDSHSDRLLDLLAAAVEPYSIEIIADDSAERSLMTGERSARPVTALERREARAAGVPVAQYTRGRMERARAAGQPLDEVLGVTADSGARFASGHAPSDVERLTVREARPNAGETIWDYFKRHLERFGLMLWMSADGKLVVGAPDWNQEASYRFVRRTHPRPGDPNTIMSGGLEESTLNSYSHVVVMGRASASEDGPRERVCVTTVNPDWPADQPDRPRYVRDPRIRTEEEAGRRGLAELAGGRAKQYALKYEVDGHGQSDLLYAQGTTAYVEDERLGVVGVFYIAGRELSGERGEGARTTIRMIKLRSFEL